MIRAFVYGTLRPGQVLWPMIQPSVKGDPECALVRGFALTDSGHNYPIMVRTMDKHDVVRGTIMVVDEEAQSFQMVHRMEIGAGYEADIVETDDGATAIAYVWPYPALESEYIPHRKINGLRIYDFALIREIAGHPPGPEALLEK